MERTQEHPYPPQAHQPPSTFVYLPTQKLYEPCTFRIFFLNTTYAFILFYYFILLFLLLFKYICLHFPPHLSSTPTSHPQSYPLLALSMGPLYMFLCLTLSLLSLIIPFPSPPWSLSVCSSFLSLWFYFAHLFVLLIRSHL